MARISMTPATGFTAADVLRTTSTEIEAISSAIRLTPCIEMPPVVAAHVEAAGQRIGARLHETSARLQDDSDYVRARAMLFEREGDGAKGRELDAIAGAAAGASLSRQLIRTLPPLPQGRWKVSNETIAKRAESQNGRGGQCLKWVGEVLRPVLGNAFTGFGDATAKYQDIWAARATEVQLSEVRRGDIIQWNHPNVHTAIVTGTGPAFTLSESNWEGRKDESGTVRHSQTLAAATAARKDFRVWRLGTVP